MDVFCRLAIIAARRSALETFSVDFVCSTSSGVLGGSMTFNVRMSSDMSESSKSESDLCVKDDWDAVMYTSDDDV